MSMVERLIVEASVIPKKREDLAIVNSILPSTRAYDGCLGVEL